jgi:hypothetical protein
MSFEALEDAIRTRFNTEITTGQSLVTQWPNAPFDKPDNALWARVTILEGATRQKTLGPSAEQRTPGVLTVQLFYPVGRGTEVQTQMADTIAAKFKRDTFSGVVFQTPYIEQKGRSGKEWQVNVICPFYYDE